jgi:hypothetical protein
LLLASLALVLAFLFNVTRTTILVWHGSRAGIDAIDEWHDGLGMSVLGVSFACLWFPTTGLLTFADLLLGVRAGRRGPGQQSLGLIELIVLGCPALGEAGAAVLRKLPELLRVVGKR